MKQILLFDTAISTSNLGDEIILSDVKTGLREILEEALVFRMGTHVANYSALQLFLKRDIKVERLCDWADYKFICGTNLLLDNLKRVNPQWMLNPVNACLYKDSILVGVGKVSDYEKPNKYTEKIYKKILSPDYKHSVRDDATKKVVEDLGFRAINTGCPTLWGFTKEKCEKIPKKKADRVIFSVSGYYSQKNPEADKKMISCLRKNYKEIYVWIQTVVDGRYLKELEETEGVTCIYSLEKYAQLLNEGNIDYVGTRLHGGIYALQHNCRSMIVSIDQRAEGFHETNNIPIIRRDDLDNLETTINSDIVTDIKVNREAIEEFLTQFR